MRIYLDDDIASPLLAWLLRQAGFDVILPSDVGMSGKSDAAHLKYAASENRICISCNHDDFNDLHELILQVGGRYPGILIIRKDNNPKRDMKPAGIVRAIRNLLASGVALENDFQILNHWR